MISLRDEFLSEEDLDLAELSWTELLAWWDLWLLQAQASNDLDAHLYSHGVFVAEPGSDLDACDLDSRDVDACDLDSRDLDSRNDSRNQAAPA